MIWITLIVITSIIFIFILDSLRLKITPTPSSKKVRQKILEILPKGVDGPIYELGSGFGQMTLDLAKHFSGHPIKSYERATVPYLVQRLLLFFYRPQNAKLLFEDFMKKDSSDAGLIFCYLYREIMPRLALKIEKSTTKKVWVISHTFAIENWTPVKIIYANDLYHTPIYLYQINPRTEKSPN